MGTIDHQSTRPDEGTRMTYAYSYTRWSTAIQKDGDSKRRQLDKLNAALLDHPDWELQEAMLDDGKSAYHQTNLSDTAALGAWIDKLRKGDIPVGSVLIIEALDRLTRADMASAIGLILQIISAGCQIYVCIDKQLINKETFNNDMSTIYILMARLQTANLESRRKSQMLYAAWENKRANAIEQPMSAMGPFWLKLSDDRSKFEFIDDLVEIIQFIFEAYLNGVGCAEIARYCNEHFPCRQWTVNGIGVLLKKTSIYGTLTRKHGKGFIHNYYPAIIDEETFNKVQYLLKSRNKTPGPRVRGTLNNLFGGRIICSVCGEKYRSQGDNSRHRLICRNREDGRGCNSNPIRYAPLENDLIEFFYTKGIISIGTGGTPSVDKSIILNQERQDIKDKLNNFMVLIENGKAPSTIITRMTELEARLNEIEKELLTVKQDKIVVDHEKIKNDFWEFLRDTTRIDNRQKITSHIREFVEGIYLDGEGYNTFDDDGNVDGRVRRCRIKFKGNDDVIDFSVSDPAFRVYVQKKKLK